VTERKTYNSLSHDVRIKAADILNRLLASAVYLSRCSKSAHWNSVGANFIAVHKLFDEIHTSADGWADTLAERARSLGSEADGHPDQIQQANELSSFPKGIADTQEYIRAVAKLLGEFSKKVRDPLDDMQETDPASANDLITILGESDEFIYLVESHM